MNKIISLMDKFFFSMVVFVAFLVFFFDTVTSCKNGDWWMFALNATTSAMIVHAYFSDWRKKI